MRPNLPWRGMTLVWFVFGSLSIGTALAEGPREVARVEGITEYQLDNGLRLLLFPDDSRPTVTVNLTVLVGSRHEGAGEGGMAHLLEHMVFKGTPTHSDIPKLLQERGARFNGSTNSDRTNYFETLPADGDNLEFALHLEADRLVNSLIRGEDLASEMTVVRNEFERAENAPTRVLQQKVMAAAYEWHNYGKPTIGNRSDIERVPIEKLRDFYRKYYQPDNVVLVIAGRFDHEEALKLTGKYFGSIPRPERELPRTYTEEPPQDGERKVVLRRVGEVGMVILVYHIPAGSHPAFASMDVLGEILTRPPSGRLYKALVEPGQAAVVMGGAIAQHDPGLLFVGASVPPDQSLDEVQQKLVEGIESMGQSGVTEEEVERARRHLLNIQERALADSGRLAVSLSSWAAQGDWRLFFLHRDALEKVTPESVQSVAADYLRPSNRTMGVFVPTDEPTPVAVPSAPDLSALVKDYRGRETVATGEQFDATPEQIEERTERGHLDAIKFALLPKKTRGETVRLRLVLRYGNETNLKELQTACSMLPSLMTRGTKQLTRQQLQDQLDKYQARLSGGGGTGSATFSLETKREHLLPVMALLQQVLREPRFDEAEFQVVRQQRLVAAENSKTEPQMLAEMRLSRTLWPYDADDIRYTPTIAERIERLENVTLEQVQRVYAEYLSAAAGELVVVGDFDAQAVKKTASDMLSGWTAKMPFERIRRPALSGVAGGLESIETPGKANAVYTAGFVLPLSDTDPDYPALILGNFVLGSSGLSSRLGDRVRQQEGLSYSVGSSFSASYRDRRASFQAYAISNPNNMDRVVTAINEELHRLLDEGIGEEELAEARQGYLRQQELSRNSDRSLVSMLAATLDADRTMEHYAQREEVVRSLTSQQVQAALRKHFDPKRLVVVTAGDFASDGP